MPTYVALLRAVNLGPRNRVAMPELRAALEADGMRDVVTHLNTGNVVLRCAARSARAVGEQVAAVLRDDLGTPVEVIVRTAAQMREAAAAHPLDAPGTGPKALHVGFLQEAPGRDPAARLDDARFDAERFVLRGAELYLLYPDGMGRSKMTGAFFERRLGVPLTVRSLAVARRLAELACA